MQWRGLATTMNSAADRVFATRPGYVVDLPLKDGMRILHPERVVLKIGSAYKDVGAFCYALRADRTRKPGRPAEVVLSSLIEQRPAQILQVIKVLSGMLAAGRPSTVASFCSYLKSLLDWADTNGHTDCLNGGDVTRTAFHGYVSHVEDRFRRQEVGSRSAFRLQKGACLMLEAITGLEDLARGVRIVKDVSHLNGGTEPAADHDFAHNLAMSQMLFDGLANLVLDNRPFPFKLELPKSLGWEHSHLWLFPLPQWRLPPHRWGAARQNSGTPHWPYDYQNGRLATVEEIWSLYGRGRTAASRKAAPREANLRWHAANHIRKAQRRIDNANANPRDHSRFTLGMIAHNAFYFLLHANSGGNQTPILDLESDGTLDKVVANQGFRAIKFRASGKEVFIPIPVSFLPSLRRFMDLRAWLLGGESCPYLFVTFGPPTQRAQSPQKASNRILEAHYNVLKRIDPQVKCIRVLATRATVNDAMLRKHDASVVARIMGHSETTEQKKYGRGSVVDHYTDMTVLLEKISSAARAQAVIQSRTGLENEAVELEEGGGCAHYGHPEATTDEPALQPNCKGGCWFCAHRVLVADEQDVRKVASARFVMEQLILGPQHEAVLRPLINKCDVDLERIAQTRNCRPMVERIEKDVCEDGNLTPYWAEKYQLFLELEVIV